MTTLTVNIENKKTEKAIKAVLDAFGLDYNIDQHADTEKRPLNKSEQVIYNRLKKSAEEIRLYKEGKIKLQDATEFLNEL
jgi:GTP cyclohydrolase I